VYLIRPAEWIPALYFNWNMLFNFLGVLSMLFIALDKNKKITTDRTFVFLIAFILFMVLSNIFNNQFSTISVYFNQVLATAIIFLLTQTAISSSKQLDKFIFYIILTILFICYQCHLQVTVGSNWGGLEPLSRGILSTFNEESGKSAMRELQVVWYGILEDPNDLGMLLIAFAPYIYNKIFYQKTKLTTKAFWALSLLIISYTVVLTNSRGSMLALIAGLGCFYIIKKRSTGGFIMAGLICLALLAVAPSRMGELTSGDYSAMGRIFAWILSLELFAMNPVFGIGTKHFLDYHFLTTHNSYVLALVETGFFGFTAYLSIFVVTLTTAIKTAYSKINEETSTEIIALASGLIGIMLSIFFISRTYVLLPFFFCAIVINYLRINSNDEYKKFISSISIIKLGVISTTFIIFIYLFNRLATGFLL